MNTPSTAVRVEEQRRTTRLEVAGRRWGFGRGDALWSAALAGLAVAVRWPHLQQIPRFTDETEDMQFALTIAREGLRPLVSNDTYNGPLFHYVLASGFAVGGGPTWPRILALAAGALTVGVVYFLGKALAGLTDPGVSERRASVAGTVAALVMATSFVPVVVNSHIAWSNSTTPLWAAAFLLVVVEAVRRNRPALLVPAGVLAGATQQTHPSGLAILLGAALWLVWERRDWLRTRWPWLAAVTALVCVGNLVWFNLTTPGGSLELAEERDYAFTGGADLAAYAVNLRGFGRLAYQMVGSSFIATIDETTDPARLRDTLVQPMTVIAAIVVLAGVAYTARRRAGIGLAVLVAAALLLPFFNQAYHHYILARYLAPLLPPAAASAGTLLAAAMASRRRLVAVAATALTAAVVIFPLFRIQAFYRGQIAEGKTNERLWQTIDALQRAPASTLEPIYIDRDLRHIRLTAGGNLANVPDGLLDVLAVPNEKIKEKDEPQLQEGAIILLSNTQRDALTADLQLELLPLAGTPAPASPDQYGAYRVARRLKP